MYGDNARDVPRIGEYLRPDGSVGRHPIRRRIAPGPPPWVRLPTNEPVVGTAMECDLTHGERDRSFEEELTRLEVWD